MFVYVGRNQNLKDRGEVKGGVDRDGEERSRAMLQYGRGVDGRGQRKEGERRGDGEGKGEVTKGLEHGGGWGMYGTSLNGGGLHTLLFDLGCCFPDVSIVLTLLTFTDTARLMGRISVFFAGGGGRKLFHTNLSLSGQLI